MSKKIFLLFLIISFLFSLQMLSFSQAKKGMTKWEYYNYLRQQYGEAPAKKMTKPGGFNDRKYGRFDVGKIGLEINNANTLGYSREMLTFNYPIGSDVTYQWCQTLIVGGILNGKKYVSNGGVGIFQEANEGHFEPLPGYDSGIGENGLAMSNKPNSWSSSWPVDVGSLGLLGFPGVKQDGEVAADAEGIWMAVDDDKDSRQLTPLHIKSYGRGLQFSSVLAEDMIVFKYYITNTGTDTIKDCFVGIYTEMDCPEEGNNEWEDDYAKFISIDEDPILGNFLYIWDGDDKAEGYLQKGVAWQGLKMLETPVGPDGQQLGQTTLSIATYTDFYALPTQADLYDELTIGIEKIHNVTPHPGDWTQTPNTYGPDVASVHASGPFDLAPGQTVTFTFANIFGVNKADLMANTILCQLLYDKNYNTAIPPIQPNVRAVAGDQTVLLYWDAEPSESSIDPLTENNSFQGYRIYRSTDRGVSWGEKITNAIGALVGYVPIAQYDLNDAISGTSIANPYFHLGDNTGLQHKFVDRNLKNGVEYWYAVCAYDADDISGDLVIPPMENPQGNDPDKVGDNTIRVVPQKYPAGFAQPAYELSHIQGASTAAILLEILNPYAIVENTYKILIDETQRPKTFSVFDAVENDTIIRNCTLFSGEGFVPSFDGMRLNIVDEEGIAFDFQKSYWHATPTMDTAATNYSIQLITASNPIAGDYEVRFTAVGDTAFGPKIPVPFEIVNVTTNQKLDFILIASPTDTTTAMKNSWTSGDKMTLRETVAGAIKFTWTIVLTAPPLKMVISGNDTTYQDISVLPKTGDVAKIFTRKPLTANDVYEIKTSAGSTANATEEDLDKINVIPNPYVVTSSYETQPWIKELQFHNLPERCEIRIFTVSGELVQILNHEPGSKGYRGSSVEAWDLWNYNEQEVAFGVFIYHVKAKGIGEKLGKFAIIK
jgi:hypothetical protein